MRPKRRRKHWPVPRTTEAQRRALRFIRTRISSHGWVVDLQTRHKQSAYDFAVITKDGSTGADLLVRARPDKTVHITLVFVHSLYTNTKKLLAPLSRKEVGCAPIVWDKRRLYKPAGWEERYVDTRSLNQVSLLDKH